MNNQWIRGGCIAAAFFMALALFLAADKAAQIPLVPELPDKLVHFCYFGIMALLLGHGFGRRWWWQQKNPNGYESRAEKGRDGGKKGGEQRTVNGKKAGLKTRD